MTENQTMLEVYKTGVASQFAAAFAMLESSIDRCPDSLWHEPVANLKFCQVAFHVLFFADFYLGENEDALRRQPFHQDHPDFFRDYEELQWREQKLVYERTDVKKYLEHCRGKAVQVIAAETAQVLAGSSGFPRRQHSRAELHVLNIRHIQHHAAQLSLRLRLNAGIEVPWVGSLTSANPR